MTKKPTGQIGIVVLLVMTVLLTVGLSLAARTTRQTEVSVQQEDSAKVFNAAESGVENALYNILQYENDPNNGLGCSTDVTDSNVECAIAAQTTLETLIEQGASAEIITTSDSEVSIEWWKDEQQCNMDQALPSAALLISVYNEEDNTAKHYPVDGCSSADRDNDFIKTDPKYSELAKWWNDANTRVGGTYSDSALGTKKMFNNVNKLLGKTPRDVSTDDLGIYLQQVGLDNIRIPNIIDGGRGDVFIEEDEFETVLDVPLGALFGVARDIIEVETQVGEFEQLVYMLAHKGQFVIDKKKPYPDKMYILTSKDSEYVFQFFVQGEPGY